MCTECQKWNQIHVMETQEIRHNVGSEIVGWPEHRLHTWTEAAEAEAPVCLVDNFCSYFFPRQFRALDSSHHRSNGPGASFPVGQFCGSRRPNKDGTEVREQT